MTLCYLVYILLIICLFPCFVFSYYSDCFFFNLESPVFILLLYSPSVKEKNQWNICLRHLPENRKKNVKTQEQHIAQTGLTQKGNYRNISFVSLRSNLIDDQ